MDGKLTMTAGSASESSKMSITFTELQPSAIRRIANERRDIDRERERLGREDEIFISWNGDDITRDYQQLIVGPDDTPYEGGFYFFEGTFCDQYPIHPMKMRAATQGLRFRHHPNYYVEGKCCLSILGTWTGPPWVPTLNVVKVAMTMKSIFTNNPLTNEPGYATSDINHPACLAYQVQVEYWNLLVAVIEMLRQPPAGFEKFLPDCQRLFLKNYNRYMNRIIYLRRLPVNSPTVYGNVLVPDKEKLIVAFNEMYCKLAPGPARTLSLEPDSASESAEDETRPSSRAKDLPEGTKVTTKDGRRWVVRESHGKRWMLDS
jgi:ubiquitin-protein ligase